MRPLGLLHPLVIGGLLLAAASTAGFIAIERRTHEPMLPLSLFADRTFSAATLFGIGVNLIFIYYGMVFVLSLYLQRVLGHSPLQTGLAFLPTGGFLLSNLASGPVTARFGSRLPMIAGALLDALGFAALMFIGRSTPTLPLFVAADSVRHGHHGPGDDDGSAGHRRQAAFGALAGHAESAAASAHIVDAVRWSAGISVALLVCGAFIAHYVRNANEAHSNDAQPAQQAAE